MKKNYKFVAFFSAVLISFSVISACTLNTSGTSNNSNSENSVSASINAEIDESKYANDNSSHDNETKISSPDIDDNSSKDSNANESSEIQESQESNIESSSESTSGKPDAEESSAPYDGYYFDDEQIVDDYHTAKVFTDNEQFNELFKSNPIDSAYNTELQNVDSITDMRSVTISYGEKWKNEVSTAYNKLSELLAENAEAKKALEDSQNEWIDGLVEIENSFYDEASEVGAGSEALLSADTAIMNYYKGRTAVLYEQIYELTGNFEM